MSPESPMPLKVFAAAAPWPLHDAAHTRAIERQALGRSAPHALMARAGLSVARLALAVMPHARRVTVLAGPGNNGGDGLVAALHLHRQGQQVCVVHLADPEHLPPDAADAHRQALAAGVPIQRDGPLPVDSDLLVDALLGLGASRAPVGLMAELLAASEASRIPVLAIDLPSGLDANTGNLLGQQAIRATWTLSLLTLKPGLFTASARDHVGEVWFDDLGVSSREPAQAWLGAALRPPPPGFAARQHAQHKGSFGDLTVVGGAAGMQGAAVLAAQAALTAGAGRVYLHLLSAPPGALPAPELMQSPAAWIQDTASLRRCTVVCGCGGGQAVAERLPVLLEHAGRLVLDADALNAIAADTGLRASLQSRGARGDATVLTPHPLEAARLLSTTTAQVQSDRLGAADRLAGQFGAVVVLKGSGSVIASPGQAPWINASGNASLAAPGSGDVLAGWLGGLWSQHAGDTRASAWWAARAATWLHGRAADVYRSARPGSPWLPLLASDLIDAMARSSA